MSIVVENVRGLVMVRLIFLLLFTFLISFEAYSFCPSLRVGDISDLVAAMHELNAENEWNTEWSGPIVGWLQGFSEEGKQVSPGVGKRNLQALKDHQGVLLLRLHLFPVPLVGNIRENHFFSHLYEVQLNRVGCKYKFYPTAIGRPGSIGGYEFYLTYEVPTLADFSRIPVPSLELQQEATANYIEQHIIPTLQLSSLAEVKYMNDQKKGSAVYKAAVAGPIRRPHISTKDDPRAAPQDKAHARLVLGLMDYSGIEIDEPNYVSARQGFKSVVDDPQATLQNQAIAKNHLDKMDKLGQGILP